MSSAEQATPHDDNDDGREKNGSCEDQSIDSNQKTGNDSPDDPLFKMRKGLFGRSATYLQKNAFVEGEESGESSKNDGDDELAGKKENEDESGIDDSHDNKDSPVVERSVAATDTVVEAGDSIGSELKVSGGDVVRDEKNPADAEEQNLEDAGKGQDGTEQTQTTSITTVKSTEGSKSDSSVSGKPTELNPETDSNGPESITDAETNGAAVKEATKVETADNETTKNVTDVEKKDSEVAEKAPAQKSEQKRKKHVSLTGTDSTHGDVEGSQETSNDPANERRKSLRIRKTDVLDEATAAKNESAAEERRKSLRTPKKPATAPTSVSRSTRREKKKEKSVSESESVDEKAVTSGKNRKKNAPSTAIASKSAQKPPKKEAAKKKRGRASESDKDPFSFDSNFDNHPEPLRNIQMERQSFGGYKFTKTPEKTLASRYQKTEQTASERRSNLIGLFSQHEVTTTPHRSLSELALSADRQIGMASSSKRKIKSSHNEFPAQMEPGGSSQALDEPTQKAAVKERRKDESRSEQKQSQSTYDFQPATKQRKRKMVEIIPAVTPKRPPKSILPELSAVEQFEADHRPNEHAPYSVGARIYALWDRLYYPARISAEQDASGRYEVIFVEDGAVRRLVATGIIPLSNLVVGRKCLTTSIKNGEEILEEMDILEVPSSDDAQQWMDALFTVKSSDGGSTNIKTPWQKLVLDANQAKALQVATVNTVRDVNADNIASVERRRSRAARHAATHSRDLTPALTPAKTRRRNTMVEKETPKRVSSSKVSTRKHEEAHVEQDEQQGPSITNTSLEQAPAPGKIFDGITFVVTSAVRKNREGEQGFSKKEIRCMIENGGGKVIDDVMKLPQGKPIYLIADTHYRTHKYLTALARSIPCVSNQWISDCARENELLDYKKYMLPAGVSLLNGELKPWHSNNGLLLAGKSVYIFSNNVFYDMPNFSQIWTPLINHMGGTVVETIPKEGLDILLTDASCTEELLNKARSQGAIVVSSEWIIQAIIHGSLPAPDAHERFQYDFSDACT